MELKEKILKQLSIISEIFDKPQVIFEIEGYDNPFSEGNFKNLKKLAKLIINQRQNKVT
jgi:hypothetical protein